MPASDPNDYLRKLAPAFQRAINSGAKELLKPPMDLIESVLMRYQTAMLVEINEQVCVLRNELEAEQVARKAAAQVCDAHAAGWKDQDIEQDAYANANSRTRRMTDQGDFEMDEATPTSPMPQYQCHKKVWALKIAKIESAAVGNNESDGSMWITPAEERFARFRVQYDYMRKHKPEVGGYYVVYDDGYKSYSPAKAFEDGYTLIS